MTAGEMQRRALAKALAAGLHKRVVRIAWGRYTVPSLTTGERYTVTHNPGRDEELHCTCPGRAHPACAHRAAVWLAKAEHKGVRVVAPVSGRKEAAA